MVELPGGQPVGVGLRRTCVLCGQARPIEEYRFRSASCITCYRARHRERYRKRRLEDSTFREAENEHKRTERKRAAERGEKVHRDPCRHRAHGRASYLRRKERILSVARDRRLAEESRVYFALAVRKQRVKIGFTHMRVEHRFRALRTANADDLMLLGSMPGDREDERRLHERFAHLRIRDEWFQALPELITFIDHQAERG